MKFKYISDNIIVCPNFVPPHIEQELRIELMNNRGNFSTPSWWTSDKKYKYNGFGKECGGVDYWIKQDDKPKNNETIMALDNWFFHQGFFEFLREDGKQTVFDFLEKKQNSYMIHVISYNNGGYYGWHQDSEFFTFNLILSNPALTGGDLLFRDGQKIIEIPNENNYMVVFPKYINHAITPILSKDGKDVPFPQQRFSIQYWVKCS
tara:strand:+ start:4274 stop:4891 length:618 start_codon:yes stop_codon:yes gene_type:complete